MSGSYNEHIIKWKPFLKHYSDQNGVRFNWSINTFLVYFEKWRNNIERRPGNFTQNARKQNVYPLANV